MYLTPVKGPAGNRSIDVLRSYWVHGYSVKFTCKNEELFFEGSHKVKTRVYILQLVFNKYKTQEPL